MLSRAFFFAFFTEFSRNKYERKQTQDVPPRVRHTHTSRTQNQSDGTSSRCQDRRNFTTTKKQLTSDAW